VPRRLAAPLALLAALALPAAVPAQTGTDPLRDEQWNQDLIHSDEAHATATGTGAVVAVIDTGVELTHPDLQGQLVAGHDFVEDDEAPEDGEGHGTHVSGIIAAAAGNGIGVSSVAPGAKIMPLRVLDDSGEGELDDVVAAIDWATDHHVDVINLSLGGTTPLLGSAASPEMGAALTRALAAGIVVVAAAGNDGLPVCDQPAAEGRILCVGAVDRRRLHSYFSNFGSGLALVAPGGSTLPFTGEDVTSTYHGDYGEVAGTSQATPHVSGIAALLVSLGVKGQAAVERILATSDDLGLPGPDALYGAGLVDAAKAVDGLKLDLPVPPTPAPASARVSAKRVQKIRDVLRKGIAVKCTASGAGRCSVKVTLNGKTVATGSKAVTVGQEVLVRAKLTKAGRKRVEKARRLVVTVRVTLPGAPQSKLKVTLKR
jgi:serine protease